MNHASLAFVFSFLIACGAPSSTPAASSASAAPTFRPTVQALQAWADGSGGGDAFVDDSGLGRLRFVHDDTDPTADGDGNVREAARVCGAYAESAMVELRGQLARAFATWNDDMAEEAGRSAAVECTPSDEGVLCHYAGYSQGDNALFLRFKRVASAQNERWVLNTSAEIETASVTAEFYEEADAWLNAEEARVSVEDCDGL